MGLLASLRFSRDEAFSLVVRVAGLSWSGGLCSCPPTACGPLLLYFASPSAPAQTLSDMVVLPACLFVFGCLGLVR